MTRDDQKMMFTAMGFLAVLLRDEPQDKQAQRAKAIAKLIENFCQTAIEEEKKVQLPAAEASVTMKRLFANLINDNQKNQNLMRDAMEALAECMEGDSADAAAADNDDLGHLS